MPTPQAPGPTPYAAALRISAVICTHNRAAYLQKAIQSLIEQTLPKDQYEIIVVDNSSTDNTKQVVSRLQAACLRSQEKTDACGLQLEACDLVRYVFEPVLGLSQARNTGWKAAFINIVGAVVGIKYHI